MRQLIADSLVKDDFLRTEFRDILYRRVSPVDYETRPLLALIPFDKLY
jgi:hypothetical protein